MSERVKVFGQVVGNNRIRYRESIEDRTETCDLTGVTPKIGFN